MNAEQQTIVRSTFAQLALMPEVAGALFYDRLFAANPGFRPMFKHDMRVQGVKLMAMLAIVVYNLHQPGEVLTAIRDLGAAMSDMASNPRTTLRSAKRCSGRSSRRWGKTSRRRSARPGRPAITSWPMR